MALSSNRFKFLQSLQSKKYRHKYGLFIVEGEKAVAEFADSDHYKPQSIISKDVDLLKSYTNRFETELAEAHQMGKISSMSTAPPICALVPFPSFDIPEATHLRNWHLGVDRLNDPGNLGSIIRIADWFGLEYLFLSENCADVYNPKTIAATMGSLARVKPVVVSYTSFIPELQIPAYAAVLMGQDIIDVAKNPGFILIGSESHGISSELLPLCNQHITIGRLGKAESLNAAVAAGIICERMMR